jgi:NADH-quinone oxidoreductase subunit B
LIVAGIVNLKMAPVMRNIYDQMADPKWVISMGACASSGGIFNVYSVTQGIDTVVPVDVYVPGCPPAPEGLLNALLRLKERIANGETHSQRREAALKESRT